MKLRPFNIADARWDAHKAFHLDCGYQRGYKQFSTGEVLIVDSTPKPGLRNREIDDMRFMYLYTADKVFDLYTPDGTKIPKAWLDYSKRRIASRFKANINTRQYLLLDLDSKQAVRLNYDYMSKQNVSDIMRYGCAMFAGPAREPIGAPIRIAPPYKPNAEEREWLAEVMATVKAVQALHEMPLYHVNNYEPLSIKLREEMKSTPHAFVETLQAYEYSFSQVVRFGIEPQREVFEVPYLLAPNVG